MKLNQKTRLADLLYGHGDKFMLCLRGKFEPAEYPEAPAIQVCELKCGCWIVGDGNNRVGLIMKRNPDATIADIPEALLSIYPFGKWDDELSQWWNPEPKTFGDVMSRKRTPSPKGKHVVHGMIERDGRSFTAMAYLSGKSLMISASNVDAATRSLRAKIQKVKPHRDLTLALRPVNQLERHRCPSKRLSEGKPI